MMRSTFFTKKTPLILPMLVVSLVCALVGAQPAGATSAYDGLKTTDTLVVERLTTSGTCTTTKSEDITSTWQTLLSSYSGSDTLTLNAKNAVLSPSDYYFFIFQSNSANAYTSVVVVTVPKAGNTVNGVFHMHSGNPHLSIASTLNTGWGQARFTYYAGASGCPLIIDDLGVSSGATNTDATVGGSFTRGRGFNINGIDNKVYLLNAPIFYPEDYEGDPVPTTSFSPDLELLSEAGDRNVIIKDNNFYTFDEVAFVCDNDLAPAIYWEIRRDETVLYDGSQSPTATINVSIPISVIGEVTFVAWYDCGEGDSHDFDEDSLLLEFTGIEPADYAPSWYISNIINYQAKIHDVNFNTFDNNPFTCEGGLAPVLHYEIWETDPNNYIVKSGYQSATAEINVDFGEKDYARDFQIKGWYDCGVSDPLQFTQIGTLDFTVTITGTQAYNLWEDCISEEFPFIHMDDCARGVERIINMLFFGEISFPQFAINPSCRPLLTIDDWLGLPNNYIVCPMVGSEIRNVVTSFVSFMLGIATVGMLRRRTGDLNG